MAFLGGLVTPTQRLLSVLLAAHMAAVLVGAIPPLEDFATNSPRTSFDPARPSFITDALDAASVEVVWLHRLVWSLTAPLRGPAHSYLRITGQLQAWNMFANPSRGYQVVRLGYHLRHADGNTSVEYEEVFPSAKAGEVKLLRAYLDSFTDKAFVNVAETYRTNGLQAQLKGATLSREEMLQLFQPFTRFYGRQRVARGLPPGVSLTAVEFWWGNIHAPAPPSGVPAGPPVGDRGESPNVKWELWATDDLQ